MALGSLQHVSANGAAAVAVTYLGSYSEKVAQRLSCHYIQNISVFQDRVSSGVSGSSSFLRCVYPRSSLASYVCTPVSRAGVRGHGASPGEPLEEPGAAQGLNGAASHRSGPCSSTPNCPDAA